jgi:hypothetical protein
MWYGSSIPPLWVPNDLNAGETSIRGTVCQSCDVWIAPTFRTVHANWILSLGEDFFVVGLGFLALQYPVIRPRA